MRAHELGDDLLAQFVGDLDDRSHDGPVGRGAVQVGDELTIDLDQVDIQCLEVVERAVTGAEVVEGEAGADVVDPGGKGAGGRDIEDRRGLGELDDDASRIHIMCGDGFGQGGKKRSIAERGAGDVEREVDLRFQTRQHGHPVADDPLVQAGAQPAGLGDADELVRHDEPVGVVGVDHSNQCLGTTHLPTTGVEDGLQVQDQSVIGKGVFESSLHHHPGAGAGSQPGGRIEYRGGIASPVLGVIEHHARQGRRFGADSLGPGKGRSAQAGGHRRAPGGAVGEVLGDRGDDFSADDFGTVAIGVAEQDHELVSAEPADHVSAAHGVGENVRHLFE